MRNKNPTPFPRMSDWDDDSSTERSTADRPPRHAIARKPAIALIVVGAVALAIDLNNLARESSTDLAAERMPYLIGIVLAFRLPMILGGIALLRGRFYYLAIAGGIASLLPTSFMLLFSVPVGIWVLVTLARSNVRRAFGPKTAQQ